MNYDVFNGDADGICALLQLRLAKPIDSQLITGVKRDIALLEKITVSAEDHLTVLDVSLDKNRDALLRHLDNGATVDYIDHHFAGDIPESANLNANINTSAEVCTSLLVNGQLSGQFVEWAIVGAYGDNLFKSAAAAAKTTSLSTDDLAQLKNLGTYMNYNGYGASVDDLHFSPSALFEAALPFANPLDFIRASDGAFEKLERGYKDDMASAQAIAPEYQDVICAAFIFPDEPWARRVSGVYGNDLAQQFPERAHAVITVRKDGDYQVSVRAPLSNRTGADELCRQFSTGGGRAAAAGINNLAPDQLGHFIDTFKKFYA